MCEPASHARVLSWCTGSQGNDHCSFLFWSQWLAVVYCLVFCIGSCEPVHEDRTHASHASHGCESCKPCLRVNMASPASQHASHTVIES